MKALNVLIAAVALGAVTFFSLDALAQKKVKGNGNLTTETRDVSTFDAIEVNGFMEVTLVQGNKESVVVKTDKNLQEYLEVNVNNGILTVAWNDALKDKEISHIEVEITLEDIHSLTSVGIGNLSCKNTLNLNELKLEVAGLGNIELDLNCQELNAEIAAIGNVSFKGKANTVNMECAGIGNLNAGNFVVQSMVLESAGLGNVRVNAVKEISIESSGIGNVTYVGGAKVIALDKSGLGEVKGE